MVQDWRELASKKRAEVNKDIPQEWRLPSSTLETVSTDSDTSVLEVPVTSGLLSAKELEITGNFDAVELVAKIASKEYSSYEVTLAFCKRAAVAHQVTNCLTEIFFGKALERAKYLDEYLEKEGKTIGALHGLPISLKDTFNVKGVSATIGYVSFLSHPPADFNSPLVDILLDNGAVLYVKTNVPQTLMTADSDNNVFGRTLNPYKLKLNAGGSSGGEGALIAMRGSIIGVGTDIAGSIRIPSLCCGNFGFMPTLDRVPYGGQASPLREGWTGIMPAAGPIARSPRDLRLFLESVVGSKPWNYDHSALGMPWRSVPKKQTLKIGVVLECPSWPVTPPILRAVRTAAEKFKDSGHNVVMLEKFPSYKDAAELSSSFLDIDNDSTSFKHIEASGEPIVPSVKDLSAPPPGGRKEMTLDDLFIMNTKRSKVQAKWHGIFVKHGLDVLVGPGSHKTASPHDTFRHMPYTLMWNLVSYPACIIPYLKADKGLDISDAKLPDYDADVVDGAPCNIQVTARSEQDEELMAAVETLSKALGMSA